MLSGFSTPVLPPITPSFLQDTSSHVVVEPRSGSLDSGLVLTSCEEEVHIGEPIALWRPQPKGYARATKKVVLTKVMLEVLSMS